jgi:hypothetical protein
VRAIFILVTVTWLACASSAGQPERLWVAKETAVEGAPAKVSRARFPLRVSYSEAAERFHTGAHCSGADSPESVIGWPDRRNQMHVAGARVVTYGFRFREGTLLIRCRADVVEVARTLN